MYSQITVNNITYNAMLPIMPYQLLSKSEFFGFIGHANIELDT